MDVPSPRTWSVREVVTALKLNGFRDGLRFLLSGRPILVIRQTTQQSIGWGTATTLAFQTESVDTDGMFDPSVNATTVTVQTGGWYRALAVVGVESWQCAINSGGGVQTKGGQLQANPNQNWGIHILAIVNGATAFSSASGAGWGGGNQAFQASGLVYLNPGDTVQVTVSQDGGLYDDGSLKTATTNDNLFTRLELLWVSA